MHRGLRRLQAILGPPELPEDSREGELQGVSRLTYSGRVCTVDMQLTRQVSPIAGLAHREQWMTKCDDGQRGHNLQEVRE